MTAESLISALSVRGRGRLVRKTLHFKFTEEVRTRIHGLGVSLGVSAELTFSETATRVIRQSLTLAELLAGFASDNGLVVVLDGEGNKNVINLRGGA